MWVADLQLALFFQPSHPAISYLPHLPPKSSLARKFAQFCSYLPNHRHFMAWRPRGLLSCRMAGHVQRSASGWSLRAQGKEQLSPSPGTHCSRESSPLLNPAGQLASPCPPSRRVSHQPSLPLGTCSALCVEDKGFTGLSPPLTTSFVFFRAKSTTNWQGPP